MAQQLKLQSDSILSFLTSLSPRFHLPEGVEIMNPYLEKSSLELAIQFYSKFYCDENKRIFVFGINPGRLGGGITGIPFTDPLKMETACGITNAFPKKTELSADFVYRMIAKYGGPQHFYSRYFITAVCPLGFTKNGRNMNYYDEKELNLSAESFITQCIEIQMEMLGTYDTCFCLGEGMNFKYLSQLNDRKKYFKQIIPLPHPRFIMQYKRKLLDDYIAKYLHEFQNIETRYFS